MSEGTESRFSCTSCGRTFAWKPELAGRKAKCGCGEVLTIPASVDAPVEEDLYDFAPSDDPPPPPARPAPTPTSPGSGKRLPMAPKRPSSSSSPSGGYGTPIAAAAVAGASAPPTLGYQRGETKQQKDRMSIETFIDMKRDIYVPTALLVIGYALSIGYFVFAAASASQAATAGILYTSLITAVKAVMLMIFALVASGPLGVSFGGVGTAALKLAAMAVFCDGCTTWVDVLAEKMTGTHGGVFNGVISFPVGLFIYWQLLIYLFSMDSQDSWSVVFALTAFSWVVKIFLVMALAAIFLGGGGGSVASSLASAPSAGASSMTAEVQELEESGSLQEARAYIAGGRQAALSGTVEALYAAGCKKVWFEVDKDINGRMTPVEVIAELPPLKDKDNRAKCYAAVKSWYTAMKHPTNDLIDEGDPYLFISLR